ncbi:hypothetical protein N9V86_04470, partial [Opitutales bacterium]|nr:hypothetical protein [Opitutales bacterium]
LAKAAHYEKIYATRASSVFPTLSPLKVSFFNLMVNTVGVICGILPTQRNLPTCHPFSFRAPRQPQPENRKTVLPLYPCLSFPAKPSPP